MAKSQTYIIQELMPGMNTSYGTKIFHHGGKDSYWPSNH